MSDDVAFDRLVPLLSQLRDTLEDERVALIARDLDHITSAADRKNELALELKRVQAELSAGGRDLGKTDLVHNSVRSLLEE